MPCRHFSCCRFSRFRVWRAIYGFDYMRSHRRQGNLGGAWFFYCLFVAGMILVLLARTTVLFLIAWEVMSVSAFALVTFEHEKEEVRRAGWIYLVAAHLGVAALIAAFLLLGSQAGSLDFAAFEHLRCTDTVPRPTWCLFSPCSDLERRPDSSRCTCGCRRHTRRRRRTSRP